MIRIPTSEELERDQAAQRVAIALTSFFLQWPNASREKALGHSAVANSLSNLILSSRRAARSVSAPPPRALPHPQPADAATVSADAVAERFSRLSLRSRSRTSAGNTRVRSSTFGRSYSPPTRSSQDQLSLARRLLNPRYGGAAEGAS